METGVVTHHPHSQRKREDRMNVLHLLVSGGIGGIEILMKNYAAHSKLNNIFVFTWKTGEIAEAMEASGVDTYATDAHKDGALVTLKKIRNICVNERIDVVVSHNSAPLLKLALLYIKLTVPHVHVVAYAHANARDICGSNKKKGLWGRKLVHKAGFWIADGVVAISQSVKKSLEEYLGVDPKKIRRIYNGTPVNAEKLQTSSDACLRLIYVGRLTREKGVQTILHGLARVQMPFVFKIAGEGEYRKELEKLTERLQLQDRVHFLGQRSDVPKLLKSADVFVHLPTWEEGFGITVIEAMAAGLICVVNNRGAMPEIVDDGVNGFVVNPEDLQALENVLEYFTHLSVEEQDKLRENARQKAGCFSVETFTEELDGYLREIGESL